MLLLRAFPLSLSIFWRFILVLPFLTIFYIVLAAISVIGALGVLSTAPVLGVLVLFILPLIGVVATYIIAMHPYLIGIRIGLRVLGFKPVSSQTQLMGGAVLYGVIEAIVAYLFLVIITAGFILLVPTVVSMAWSEALDVPRVTDPMADLARQIAVGTLAALPLVRSVTVMALRAGLLPVLAGVAAGRDPQGRFHSPINAFGANFVTMFLLLLIITAISALVIPYMVSAVQYIGLIEILSTRLGEIILFAANDGEFTFSLDTAVYIAIAVLISIWLFCLQCAGAALSYLSLGTTTARQEKAMAAAQKASTQSIAELRKSRMSDNFK